jgi:pimeloyl-ACP methyl ester carboxylesterase
MDAGALEEGAVRVDGGELYFKQAGQGAPLLLIHGVGPDSRAWSPTFEQLAEDHRVIAYDRRGYGRSAGVPPGGGWARHGEDAAALVASLDPGPLGVAGWSGGGYVALSLAADHQDLVTGVVIAETGVAMPPVATGSFLRALARAKVQRRLRGERAATETFIRWVLDEGDHNTTWDRFDDERRERLLGNSRGVWADMGARGRPDLSKRRLAAVRCPVTILVGTIGQPWFRRSAEALAKMLPEARIETVPGTNHAFTFHQPEAFAQAIRRALS